MAEGTELCKGGCGRSIPKNSATGYARGHLNGCTTSSAPGNQLARRQSTQLEVLQADEVEIEEPERVQLLLTEEQLDRIYTLLPIAEKGLAVSEALLADRS